MPVRHEPPTYLAPPPALLSRNPARWLRFFGPGAIIASLNVGSGEVLFPSRSGAIFGYRILWIFLLIAALKWVMAYTSMRHMILTGAHPYERWSRVAGPRGWLPMFVVVVAVLCTPVWSSFLQGITGTVSAWVFGIGDHYQWATVCVALSVVLLSLGGYAFLERVQLVILSAMVVCIFIAATYVRPDWWQVVQGLFVPRPMAYPSWATDLIPALRERTLWVEIMVYAAALGGQSYDYLAYCAFLREKGWGRAHLGIAEAQELRHIAAHPSHPARLWVRAALVDTVLSFAAIVIIAAVFTILGTAVLQPQRLIPDGVDLLNHQARFLTALSPWLLPLYQAAVLLAFFGSLYAGPEMTLRIIHEYLLTVPRLRSIPFHTLRWAVIGWVLLGGLAVLWLSRWRPGVQLIDIVTPAGIYTGVLLCGFYCGANLWADRRFLPRALRIPRWLQLANLVGGLAFALFGVKALWDYDGVRSVAVLALLLCGSALLARSLHPWLYRPREARRP